MPFDCMPDRRPDRDPPPFRVMQAPRRSRNGLPLYWLFLAIGVALLAARVVASIAIARGVPL